MDTLKGKVTAIGQVKSKPVSPDLTTAECQAMIRSYKAWQAAKRKAKATGAMNDYREEQQSREAYKQWNSLLTMPRDWFSDLESKEHREDRLKSRG